MRKLPDGRFYFLSPLAPDGGADEAEQEAAGGEGAQRSSVWDYALQGYMPSHVAAPP